MATSSHRSESERIVRTVPRPYTLIFLDTGSSCPLTQAEADRLLAEYPIVSATRNRVELRGDGVRSRIVAATLGGGPAFEIER